MSETLTVKEAADTLRVCEKTVYRWIRSGEVPAYRVGRSYRIPTTWLQWLVEQALRSGPREEEM